MIRTSRSLPLSLLLVIAAAGPAATTRAQADAKKATFAVVQVEDEFRVVASGEVASLQESLKKEFQEAVKAHAEAAKAAKAGNQKAPEAPKAKRFKLVKDGLEETAAQDMMAKLEAGEGGKKEKADKEAKPAKAAKPKPEPKPAKAAKPAKPASPAKPAKGKPAKHGSGGK